jgi:hypothetical protein
LAEIVVVVEELRVRVVEGDVTCVICVTGGGVDDSNGSRRTSM